MVYSELIDLLKLKCSPFYNGEINMTRYYCLGNIVELTKTVQTLHYGKLNVEMHVIKVLSRPTVRLAS